MGQLIEPVGHLLVLVQQHPELLVLEPRPGHEVLGDAASESR
jgi:hypothetical protein